MTILVDARPLLDPHAGGVPRVAAGLLPALVAAMPETQFVFATTGWNRARLPLTKGEHEGVFLRHLRLPNKLWSLLCFARFVSFDHLAKADILFLPNIGFVGRPKNPYALLVHDLSFLIEPRWFSWKSRLWHRAVGAKQLIRNARHLFAVSETTKRDLIDLLGIAPARITVIPFGLSPLLTTHYSLPAPLADRPYLLALGANDPRKNAACAMAAAEAVRLPLVLVGRDLGRPDDQALATLMKHAAVFLYPSWYEGFGLPLREAARFGTPCVASTAGALPETAPAGALFAPPSKPHLWVAAIKKILKDPASHRTSTSLGDWSSAADIIAQTIHAPRP